MKRQQMETPDLNLRRFTTKLNTEIVSFLDNKGKDETALLSMGVAALFLSTEAGMPLRQSNVGIVDGGDDLGIDGIWLDGRTDVLHIVSAKFRTNQKKSFDQGDVLKFQRGVEKIINNDLSDAGQKLQLAHKRIEGALSDINTKIRLSLLSTGKANLQPNCKKIIEDYCKKKNDIDEVFEFNFIRFEELYRMARLFSQESTTDVSITVASLGFMNKPFQSYFGHVSGSDVASWVKRYGTALFSQNVRFTLLKSEVNDQIIETIKKCPHLFWYFNNGITAISAEAKKAPVGGEAAIVHCKNLSIVNGAQTAGMLARAADEGADLSDVRVAFRVISLVGSEPGFDEEVTRANNTQNELNALDFVSLDVRQELLQNEILALGYQYIFKRGADLEADVGYIEVKEAAVALACACEDLSIAVQAKRYVSGLWRNIKTRPYTDVFREDLRGADVVAAVLTMRKIENVLKNVRQNAEKSDALIFTHGDKFIAHLVFRVAQRENFNLPNDMSEKEIETICKQVKAVFNKKHSGGFPSTVFKNVGAQESMRNILLASQKRKRKG